MGEKRQVYFLNAIFFAEVVLGAKWGRKGETCTYLNEIIAHTRQVSVVRYLIVQKGRQKTSSILFFLRRFEILKLRKKKEVSN